MRQQRRILVLVASLLVMAGGLSLTSKQAWAQDDGPSTPPFREFSME
jgi:hypothetical protein